MEQKKLEILVVEDKFENIESAKEQLSNHNLTVCQTYNEAIILMGGKGYYGDREKLKETKSYDVMLTDLFFPWSDRTEYPISKDRSAATKEEPLGYALAITALNKGIKKVGILTNSDHHSGAVAATTDNLSNMEGCKILDGLYLFTSSDSAGQCSYERSKGLWVKDWIKTLDIMHANGKDEFREIMIKYRALRKND